MEEKQLTLKLLKKLKEMDFDDKVRLYARLRVLRQNKQISGIIANSVGFESFTSLKSEITHHLYDGNDNYTYSDKYNEMFDAMCQNKNIFPFFDTYTMCAYMIYFEKFIEYAKNVYLTSDLRYAKDKALQYVKSHCNFDRKKLNMGYDESTLKLGTLLKPEYRRSVVRFLASDLKIKNGFDFVADYMNDEYIMEDSVPVYDSNKVYANTVEEYKDENGEVYYLDTEGNLYTSDDIADYEHNGITISATDHGLTEHTSYKEEEFER